MTSQNRPQLHQEGGFTLIEILVAIVVLSIGLLGLAGLQAVSLNNNQIAYYRAIASQQAYDMADRIRANLAGVRAGDYDALDTTTPADPDCVANVCSASQMAIADHSQWNTLNARLLPGGAGTVTCCTQGTVAAGTCVCNPANRAYEIAVTWTEKAASGTAAQTQSFVTKFAP